MGIILISGFSTYIKNDTQQNLIKFVEQSPVRTKAYWKPALEKPVWQRIAPASPEVVEYVIADNAVNGFPNKPSAVTVQGDFTKDVQDAITEMPPQVRALIDKELAGIVFVKNLGGTAYTQFLNSADGLDAGFIVLDVDVLENQTANAWSTWKENTPFKTDAKFKLISKLERKEQDNRKNAIQYILLHEIAHVISINRKFHPRWDKSPVGLNPYPFAQLSWVYSKEINGYASHYETQFPLRKEVRYYFGAKLAGAQMANVYAQIEDTNYPTLYAATNFGDDFAESFASYVHTILMKRPLEISIYENRILKKKFGACWEKERCAEKRKILEEILKI